MLQNFDILIFRFIFAFSLQIHERRLHVVDLQTQILVYLWAYFVFNS